MRTCMFFSLFSLFIIVAGCGKKMEETAIENRIKKETGADANVNLDKKSINIKGESEGEKYELSAGEGTKLPDNFPDDIFIFKPSKTQSSMKTGNGFSCVFQTEDNASAVTKKYKTKMASKGWTEEASMNMNGQNMLMYSKENRFANISIGETDGKTNITVTVAKQ